MPTTIILSVFAGVSIPFFSFSSSRIVAIKTAFMRHLAASVAGFLFWLMLILLLKPQVYIWDIICGILVILCAIWSNYWLGNLGGGFRVNLLLKISEQNEPVTLEKWMSLYGGLGMNAFLEDRLNSILIPWGIVQKEGEHISLTKKRGSFFSWGISILYQLLQGSRRE